MRVIGVIDVRQGMAVHAQGGRRDRYEPVRRIGAASIEDGDPQAVVRAYASQFGIKEVYMADLDAIEGFSPQKGVVSAVAPLCARGIWLDAGVTTVPAAQGAREAGASRVIVGLETLHDWNSLVEICCALAPTPVAFGLDLRHGSPVIAAASSVAPESPEAIARQAVDAGASALVVLDLARVGSGQGVDLGLIRRLRSALPTTEIVAGGGVGSVADLDALATAGCDGALVATALHDGRIRREDLHSRLTR